MRLFLLTRRAGYDAKPGEYEGFVVCAVTPGDARQISHDESGFSESSREGIWLDGTRSSCIVIGRPSGPVTGTQLILSTTKGYS